MSTQKGNVGRSRPQKYQNRTAFKNNLHDTSQRTKQINSTPISGVCQHCKEIIEWKIKYKKYKPLTQPRKCIKCEQKTVKHAYHIMCLDCNKKLGVCTKCLQSKEIVEAPPSEQDQQLFDNEMRELLKTLQERKRRTFIRYMKRECKDSEKSAETMKKILLNKLEDLKVEDDEPDVGDDIPDDFSDVGDSDEDFLLSGENHLDMALVESYFKSNSVKKKDK